MGLGDKIKNAAQKLRGKGKQVAGEITADRSLEAEGKGDQRKADLKSAGEKIKDAFKRKKD
ncbi:CsbD family protein [Arthrobacter sp. I2-34]|uniref:CsbD family protein n=1 Tax=Arthrobacter hankyongi TaxID=2904801 RepID=A0ABS9L8W8_9MICC|nr:CsbD family protein [Arthrobacter hankyongi]MCG2623132.1 CsbD family protein [Arthrobacter hankyongi]